MKTKIEFLIVGIFVMCLFAGCKHRDVQKVDLLGFQYQEYEYYQDDDGNYIKDGYFKEWYENGQLRILCNYSDGKLDGKYQKWSYDGHILEKLNYSEDKIDGECKVWDSKGNLIVSAKYEDGCADGDYSVIQDGEILEKGIYKNGKREGEWIIDKDTFVYENGIPSVILGDWTIVDKFYIPFLGYHDTMGTANFSKNGTCQFKLDKINYSGKFEWRCTRTHDSYKEDQFLVMGDYVYYVMKLYKKNILMISQDNLDVVIKGANKETDNRTVLERKK